jgi:hypothetical protein
MQREAKASCRRDNHNRIINEQPEWCRFIPCRLKVFPANNAETVV